jgi:DNA invertase Pin-like site-specific DNA recombinase
VSVVKITDHTKMIGYCRVSTVEQADNGHSIDAQRAAITAAAETRGWEILWVEDAVSAKDLNRPGLAYALHLLGTGQAGGVVVSRLDRLSRSVHDLAILQV